MGTPFRGSVLGVLERIYQFVGGKGPKSELELDLPLQLVHDVSRQSELGAAYGPQAGYYLDENQHAHAAAVQQSDFYDPYLRLQNGSILFPFNTQTSQNFDIWLIALQTWTPYADRATVVDWSVALAFDASTISTGVMPVSTYPVAFTIAYNESDAAGANDYETASFDGTRNYAAPLRPDPEGPPMPTFLHRPIFIPHGARLTFVSHMTATNEVINFIMMFWAGPRGITPPGVR